jgi:hypothetical protein
MKEDEFPAFNLRTLSAAVLIVMAAAALSAVFPFWVLP